MRKFSTISPVDGSVYVERSFAADAGIDAALQNAHRARSPTLVLRQPCRGEPGLYEGFHRYDFEFESEGEVEIRLEILGVLGVERDTYRITLDSIDS